MQVKARHQPPASLGTAACPPPVTTCHHLSPPVATCHHLSPLPATFPFPRRATSRAVGASCLSACTARLEGAGSSGLAVSRYRVGGETSGNSRRKLLGMQGVGEALLQLHHALKPLLCKGWSVEAPDWQVLALINPTCVPCRSHLRRMPCVARRHRERSLFRTFPPLRVSSVVLSDAAACAALRLRAAPGA
jgi:hypothetical protein